MFYWTLRFIKHNCYNPIQPYCIDTYFLPIHTKCKDSEEEDDQPAQPLAQPLALHPGPDPPLPHPNPPQLLLAMKNINKYNQRDRNWPNMIKKNLTDFWTQTTNRPEPTEFK